MLYISFSITENTMENFGKSNTRGEREKIRVRGQIVGLWKGRKIIFEICIELGCSRSTAKRWINRSLELEIVTIIFIHNLY